MVMVVGGPPPALTPRLPLPIGPPSALAGRTDGDTPASVTRTGRSFGGAIVVIVVMAVVNVVAFLTIQNAGDHLHNEASQTLLAAQHLQFDAADMNGAQNLYVLDNGNSRNVFLASELRLGRSIAAARRVDTSSADRVLLGRISANFGRFRALD